MKEENDDIEKIVKERDEYLEKINEMQDEKESMIAEMEAKDDLMQLNEQEMENNKIKWAKMESDF